MGVARVGLISRNKEVSCTPVMPALGRLRQEVRYELEARLGYKRDSSQKSPKKVKEIKTPTTKDGPSVASQEKKKTTQNGTLALNFFGHHSVPLIEKWGPKNRCYSERNTASILNPALMSSVLLYE